MAGILDPVDKPGSVEDDLTDIITCPVCWNSFQDRDPRSLACLHAFCKECIKQIHQTALAKGLHSPDEVVCPTCQTTSKIPNSSIDNFPKFFHGEMVKDILGRLQQQHLEKTDTHKCMLCQDIPVVCCCLTCKQLLCKSCHIKHDSDTHFQEHVQTDVTDDATKAFICQEHNLLVETFCTECLIPVCKRCEFTAHSSHPRQRFCLSSGNLDEIPSKIECELENIDHHINTIDHLKSEFDDNIQDVNRDVTHHVEQILKNIGMHDEGFRAEIERHRMEVHEQIHHTNEQLSSQKQQLLNLSHRSKSLANPFVQAPTLSITNVEVLLDELEQKVPQSKVVLPSRQKLKFTAFQTEINVGTLDMGAHGQTEPSQSHAGSQILEPNRASETRCSQQTLETEKSTEVEPDKVNKIWVTNVKGEIVSLDLLPNGDILMILFRDNVKRLVIYKPDGSIIPAPFEGTPSDVRHCIVHQATSIVAVVGLHSFTLFSPVFGKWLSTTRRLDGEILQATFLANGELLIAIQRNWRMLGFVLSTKGFLIKFSVNGQKLWEKNFSRNCHQVTVDSQNRIIASVPEQLHVYKDNGDWLCSIPHKHEFHLLQKPRGICVDSGDNILVADNKCRAILMFSSDGKYLKELVKVDGTVIKLLLVQGKSLLVGTKEGILTMLQL